MIGDLLPGIPDTYLGYKEAHELMGISLDAPRWDASLKNHGLVDLAQWTTRNNVPKITGLIVNQKSLKPGQGFFRLFGKSEDDEEWWHDQARESILFDWSDYIEELELPTREELEELERSIIEGTVRSINIRSRYRCERLKKRAKAYHRGTDGILRCKACGWYNFAPASFVGDIVELHHVEAVRKSPEEGKVWLMREAIKNLIPLCPTCHRLVHALSDHQTYSLEELEFLIGKYSKRYD